MVEIPMRLDTAAAARYLRDKHGIPIEEKTLRNRPWQAGQTVSGSSENLWTTSRRSPHSVHAYW